MTRRLATICATGAARLRRRLSDDRGQTAAEYLGIIVVVAAIIGVLATTGLGGEIKSAISSQITKISGGGNGGGAPAN